MLTRMKDENNPNDSDCINADRQELGPFTIEAASDILAAANAQKPLSWRPSSAAPRSGPSPWDGAGDDDISSSNPDDDSSSASGVAVRPPPKQPRAPAHPPSPPPPPPAAAAPHLIPLNASGHRLDPALPQPPPAAFEAFHRRAKASKPCNDLNLLGACSEQSWCRFSHAPLSPDTLAVLRVLNAHLPCSFGKACRSGKCYRGHLCKRAGCDGGGKCRFGREGHGVDGEVAAWVEAE